MVLNIPPYCSSAAVYLLCPSACSCLWPDLKLGNSLLVEFWDFFYVFWIEVLYLVHDLRTLFLKLEKSGSSRCLSKSMFYLRQYFSLSVVLSVLYFRNLCLTRGRKDFLYFFFLSSLILLVFIFRSVIHFELIFVCGVEFMFFNINIQLFQHCLFKR